MYTDSLQAFVLIALCTLLPGSNKARSDDISSHQIFNKSQHGLEKKENVPTPTNKLICFYVFTKVFSPRIMEGLCTHINVGFLEISKDNHTLEVSDEQEQLLEQVISLKEEDKDLKIIISVGGAGDDSFSSMVKNHTTRKMFIRSSMEVIKKFKLDGIDLDWEWPVVMDGDLKEKIKFVQLLHEIREEFDRHKKKYILSADVSSVENVVELGYYVNYMADYIDYVNIMCYDYHFFSKFYPFTGHNAPLYSTTDNLLSKSINQSINFWISKSMPREKIVVGIPTYGHTFQLIHSNMNSLNAPAKGVGSVGQNGFADYQQICEFLKLENSTLVYDNISKVPYAYHFPEWISYDDEGSLAIKMSGKEEMMNCPYNMAHVILKQRMAAHLVKCRQQHPVERFETCPFNSTHDVPAPEFQYHVEVCPDRKQLEKCMYVLDEPAPQGESSVNIELPSASENWDEESSSGASYLNIKDQEVEKQMVFRLPVGMSKTERKAFTQNETQRFEKASEKSYPKEFAEKKK